MLGTRFAHAFVQHIFAFEDLLFSSQRCTCRQIIVKENCHIARCLMNAQSLSPVLIFFIQCHWANEHFSGNPIKLLPNCLFETKFIAHNLWINILSKFSVFTAMWSTHKRNRLWRMASATQSYGHETRIWGEWTCFHFRFLIDSQSVSDEHVSNILIELTLFIHRLKWTSTITIICRKVEHSIYSFIYKNNRLWKIENQSLLYFALTLLRNHGYDTFCTATSSTIKANDEKKKLSEQKLIQHETF